MKWFKHMSDMRNDLFIKQLRFEHGLEGYGMWCLLLEIYADECGNDPGGWVSFNPDILRRELGVSRTKMESFLNFCSEFSKLSFNFCQKKLEIKIPKMASLRDNFTRHLQAADKSLEYKKKKEEEEGEEDLLDPPTRYASTANARAEGEEVPEIAQKAANYVASQNNPNFTNLSWISGYFQHNLNAIRAINPNANDETIMSCWMQAIDSGIHRNKPHPNYLKSVFEGKLRDFGTGPPPKIKDRSSFIVPASERKGGTVEW